MAPQFALSQLRNAAHRFSADSFDVAVALLNGFCFSGDRPPASLQEIADATVDSQVSQ